MSMIRERKISPRPIGRVAISWIRDRCVALYHGWWR